MIFLKPYVNLSFSGFPDDVLKTLLDFFFLETAFKEFQISFVIFVVFLQWS